MVQINVLELVEIMEHVKSKLKDLRKEVIEVEVDFYKQIGTDEWHNFTDDIDPDIGSLKDDWESLQKLIKDDTRILTMVDFDRLSSVLRALSEKISPH